MEHSSEFYQVTNTQLAEAIRQRDQMAESLAAARAEIEVQKAGKDKAYELLAATRAELAHLK